jgi:hypothetical protein
MTVDVLDVTKLRQFKRTMRLSVYRMNTPDDDTSFVVSKETAGSNGMVITDLRMEFDIERDLSKNPNQCSVKITNLNQASRAAVEKKPLHVVVEAGYDGSVRLLYEGDMIFGMSTLEHPNWTTLIQLGDGARASASARISKSYSEGTTIRTALKDVCKSLGQGLPKNLESDKRLDAQFESGEAMFGASKNELTRLLTPYGYSWSFQNNKLQILRDAEVNTDFYEISESTGMIGSPDFGTPPKSGKPPHITIRSLLYPELRPGCRALVKSRSLNGMFKIVKVSHKGDTHGTEWETTVEVKPV